MKTKAITRITMALLLLSAFTLPFNIQPVEASGTIYIRSDGSVDPPTAPISTVDKVTYTFTDNIYDEIVVERDDIVVDVAGYTLQGTGSGTGIDLSARSNVTVKNADIQDFEKGIYLRDSIQCTLIDNNMTNNQDGITVESIGGVVVEKNEFSNNSASGIMIAGESNVVIRENTIKENKNGIATDASATHSGIVVTNNTILWNQENGICIHSYDQSDGDSAYSRIYNVTVSSNDVLSNGQNGIYIHSYGHGQTFSGYAGYGYIYSVTLSSNNVSCNDENGIYIHSYGYSSGNGYGHISNVTVSSNNVSTNGQNGIYLYSYGYNRAYGYGYGHIYNVDLSSNNVSTNGQNGTCVLSYGGSGYGGSGYGYIYNVTLSTNNVLSNANGICMKASEHYATLVCDISMSENIISANSQKGIWVDGGINANITRNSISYNGYGIRLDYSSNNVIYHNNIVDNAIQAGDDNPANNDWHHPSLLEGNYWSDYTGIDDGSGTGKHAIAGDGIGDTNIPWPDTDCDYYPFVKESGWVRAVETTDETGEGKDVFEMPETVYISGSGYSPSTIYDLYTVEDASWTGGMDIPDRVSGTETSVTTDENGNIPAGTVAWNGPLTPGKYDIVIDVNSNRKYDEDIDALDDEDIEVTAGFFVIPEYPLGGILGLVTSLAVLAVFKSKRVRIHL